MSELHLDRIGQIHISVDDVPRAVAFYRDVLGMRFLFEVPGQPMAFFDCGGVRLYLGRPERPDVRSNPLLYYTVPDLVAACDALRAKDVPLDAEPHLVHRDEHHELWMAALHDPDDNPICLMEERPLSD